MESTSTCELNLDDPLRYDEIRATLSRKPALRGVYNKVYAKYREVITRSPKSGLAIEIGAGAGFAKDLVPDLVTTDIIPYKGVEKVVDACKMPFADQSLRTICMWNVFHHIPDAQAFLSEADRCLAPGGRIIIADQHNGLIGRFIFKNFHHEPFFPEAKDWHFASSGPLSGANGALAWIVFRRDLKIFEKNFPRLKLLRYETHSPLLYWLAGGLKAWSLVPSWATGFFLKIDHFLVSLYSDSGSFVFIEIEKSA